MAINDLFKDAWLSVEASKVTEETKIHIDQNSKHFIMPFQVYTGFQNISSNGVQVANAKPQNYQQFSRAFTGKEGVVAIWKDSLKIWADVDENNTPINNYYNKELSRGFAFKGRIDTSTSSVEFGKVPGENYFGEYTQWSSLKKFVIDTTTRLYDSDLYNLYMVPQATEDKQNDITLLYIANIDYYFDKAGNFVFNKVLFASLNDTIASSGQSIMQFVQFGSPGEGYAIPKIIYDSTGVPIDYTLNEDFSVDRGIDTIQIEILGPAAFTAPIIQGRPIEELGIVNKVYPPRDLLMRDIKYPLSDNLTRQSNPESTYSLSVGTPQLVSAYSDWKERMQANYTDTIIKKFDGWFATDQTATKASNSNALSLKDVNLIFNNKAVVNLDFDVRASGYFNYQQDSKKVGVDRVNPSQNGRARLFDMMNLFSFMFRHLRSLPIDSIQKVPWTLSSLPLIGGFLNKLTLGIPVGWRQVDNKSDITFPNFNGLPFFVSSSLYNWYVDAFWDSNKNKGLLPLDMFKTGTQDSVGGIVGGGSMTTTFAFRLSDKVSATMYNLDSGRYPNKAISTVYLGQQSPTNEKDVYLVDSSMQVLEPDLDNDYITDIKGTNKYIIDLVGFTGVVKAPVRITMFQNDPDQSSDPYQEIVYQTTLQSASMFTDNIRDLHTTFKLTYIDEFLASQVEFQWPRPLPQPAPSIDFANISVDMGQFNLNIPLKNNDTILWNETYFDENDQLTLYDFAQKGLNTSYQIRSVYSNIAFIMSIKAGMTTYYGISVGQNQKNNELNVTTKSYNLSIDELITGRQLESYEYSFTVRDNSNGTVDVKFLSTFSISIEGSKLILARRYFGTNAKGVYSFSGSTPAYSGGRTYISNSFSGNLNIFAK